MRQKKINRATIMGQKRQRDSKGSKGPSAHANKRKKAANATNKNDSWDGFVGLEDLNWKEVPLPDRIEDAGGFFGLEEIEGIDIVRPNDNGEVRFRVGPSSSFGMLEARRRLTIIRPSPARRKNRY